MSRGRQPQQFQRFHVHTDVAQRFQAYTALHDTTYSNALKRLLKLARRRRLGDLDFIRNHVWKHRSKKEVLQK